MSARKRLLPRQPRPIVREWLITGLAATALCLVLVFGSFVGSLDNVLYDAVIRLGGRPTRADVIVVAIDDQSLQALGPWPWPRSRHGQLIDRLTAAGPRVIGYDVLFVDPAAPAEDQALAGAMARAGDVCLPVLIEQPGPNGADFLVRPPVPPIAEAAAGLGHVALRHDPDGVSRRADLSAGDPADPIPHLMSCVARVGTGAAQPRGEVLIPYLGGAGHVRTASAASVLRGETPEAFFRDAFVLVGVTASGLHDRHATPMTRLGGAMPGVEVQANLLSALLEGSGVREAGLGARVVYVLFLLWLTMAALLALPPRRALPFGFAVLLLGFAISALLLYAGRVWLPPFAAVVAILLVFPLWGWRRLQAASSYMLRELEAFSREPDLLPGGREAAGADSVDRQIQLMDQALRRMRDLRRFAADTLSSLPDPTLVVDPAGKILFANPAARGLAGGSEAGLQALTQGWTTMGGEPLALAPAVLAAERWSREVVAPGGRAFLAAVAPYRDSKGGLVACIVRLTDITELKAAAAQREQIAQLLTHDMRSPQSSILAVLEGAGQDAVRPDVAERLAGYARRTLALAEGIVQLARAGSDALEFEVLDLSAATTEAMDDLWPQARRAKVSLRSEGDDVERLILGERSLLARALVNLIDNGIKHSPPGSAVVCRLSTVDGSDGARARLEISDHGRGMTQAQQAKLFTPFQRFVARDGRGPEGAGLGLTLVLQVVRRHRGEIACRSGADGTTFVLTFPLADQAPGVAPD